MGKVPVDLRRNIATNIRNCRFMKYPMWGGSKQCAEAFGVTPQKWSQWERGAHMPDEFRMIQLAQFFGVTTEWLRRNNEETSSSDIPRPRSPYIAPSQGKMLCHTSGFGAVRIDNGVEIPLKIEVERVVYQSNYVVTVERIL